MAKVLVETGAVARTSYCSFPPLRACIKILAYRLCSEKKLGEEGCDSCEDWEAAVERYRSPSHHKQSNFIVVGSGHILFWVLMASVNYNSSTY